MLNDEVSKRIRELRIKKEITQEILSNRAGIDLSYLGKIERGQKNNISLELLDKIISGLGVSYDEFFSFESSDDDLKKIQYDISIANDKEQVLNLINGIIKLDKENKN
ncbi:helix-turn-helix domain-containing protein [Vagococcus carniphilus]|uniref:HTH cro/C1-type domain-containing protein n=1 Tax=Vagococcus carniphilus TaxID=218144 RepID=A0A430ARW2_9ENTE|nr:helix-turn-helix transcriptional regulator [Vagococcus carniphilus]QNN73275.1 helix-turn-helix transcriptional regulator [Vagococcus carniphilus]RSU10787.1 hypothetical protein CBF28_12870 [Vagococcus carniphilus]